MLIRTDQRGSESPLGAPEGARVLVVDDCCDTAYICAKVLRSAGFEVVTAFDGFEALKVASEFLPRVTLLDIGLPDIDGFEVGRRLRADGKLKTMTLVALTAFASDDTRSRAMGGDFDYFLVKPIPIADLLDLVVRATRLPTDRTETDPGG